MSQQSSSCSSPMNLSNNSNNNLSCDQDQKSSSNNQKNTLTVTDNRTGKSFEIPIEDGYFINSTHFKKMVVDGEDKNGIM